jgi:hypothetical protein
MLNNGMKSMPTKHKGTWSLRLGTHVVKHPEFQNVQQISPTFYNQVCEDLIILHKPHLDMYIMWCFC